MGLLLGLPMLGGPARAADPVRIFAAGSLGTVLPELIAASGLPQGAVAPPVFGPTGMLRQRLVAGETADLIASADLAQPQAVAAAKEALAVPFARNRMCVLAPEELGLTAGTMLDLLLSPDLRLAVGSVAWVAEGQLGHLLDPELKKQPPTLPFRLYAVPLTPQ